MKEKGFSTKEAISFGWQQMKKYFWFFVVFLIATTVIQGIFTDRNGLKDANPSLSLIGFFVSVLIALASTKLSLDAANNKTLNIDGIKDALKHYVNFLLLMILYGLIVLAGLILLIIPGFIWGIKYSMAPYLLIDKKLSVTEALQESAKITSGKRIQLFGFCIVLLLVIIAGAIALGVGLFAAIPTVYIAHAYVYNKLK